MGKKTILSPPSVPSRLRCAARDEIARRRGGSSVPRPLSTPPEQHPHEEQRTAHGQERGEAVQDRMVAVSSRFQRMVRASFWVKVGLFGLRCGGLGLCYLKRGFWAIGGRGGLVFMA